MPCAAFHSIADGEAGDLVKLEVILFPGKATPYPFGPHPTRSLSYCLPAAYLVTHCFPCLLSSRLEAKKSCFRTFTF